MNETVLKIKVLRGGTQGAVISFTKHEIKDQINWENSVDKKVKWPVQGQFKKDMEFLGSLYCKVMEIKNDKGFIGTKIERMPGGYVISAQKLYYIGTDTYVGDFKSIPVNDQHPMHSEINAHMLKLEEHLKEYSTTSGKIDRKQLMLDLVEEGKIKLPEELENVSIEDIEDPAILERFKIALENRGAVIIDASEGIVDDDKDGDTGFDEEDEAPVRKLAVANG